MWARPWRQTLLVLLVGSLGGGFAHGGGRSIGDKEWANQGNHCMAERVGDQAQIVVRVIEKKPTSGRIGVSVRQWRPPEYVVRNVSPGSDGCLAIVLPTPSSSSSSEAEYLVTAGSSWWDEENVKVRVPPGPAVIRVSLYLKEHHSTSSHALWGLGVEFGGPQKAAFSVKMTTGLTHKPDHPVDLDAAGSLGLAGLKFSVGPGVMTNSGATLSARVVFAQTYGRPLGAPHDTTWVGGEVAYNLVHFFTVEAGVLVPIGGRGGGSVFAWSIGIGIPVNPACVGCH